MTASTAWAACARPRMRARRRTVPVTRTTRAQSMETQRTIDRGAARRASKRCASCGQRYTGEAAFCPFDGSPLEAATYEALVDPLIGVTVDGRYEVMTLLGEGGMGHVYEVKHVALDRRFAMKVLRRELARDEELAARFIQEAKATASVRHPNVVEITDFGRLQGDGAPYFVMELLVGETLGHVIKAGGPIPARRAVRIVKQVAGALAAAHAVGIVHRDLKPDNVFLVGGFTGGASSDEVRVVDFGAAKIIGSSRVTRAGIVFGTPHYMSPEQASGQPVDHRTDVYALGVIMYEMFTGRVPFEADTYMGVLTQHMFVNPVPPSQISPAARELGALEQITMICLAKKPEERYASMEALSDALDEVVQVRSDGRMQVASHLSGRPSKPPSSVRYRMADELEPPTLAEMRVAIDSVLPPRRVVPWGWILGLAGVIVAGLVVWVIGSRSSVGPAVVVPVATVAAPQGATVELGSASASASASAPARTPAPASASASASEPALAPEPAPVRRAGKSSPPPSRIDDVGDPFAGKR
jgi:serine/threonine protein kinase